MSRSTSTVLIRPASVNGSPETLRDDLGFSASLNAAQGSFGEVGENLDIWIGSIDDCVVLGGGFALSFFEDLPDEIWTKLFQHFPGAEVAVLGLNSVVEAWGFAVFRNGELIRRADNGWTEERALSDFGPRLPIEDAFLSRMERIEKDGAAFYRDKRYPQSDEMTAEDFGESFVDEIFRSFTGFTIDDQELFNLLGTGFASCDPVIKKVLPSRAGPLGRPWWRFWR